MNRHIILIIAVVVCLITVLPVIAQQFERPHT